MSAVPGTAAGHAPRSLRARLLWFLLAAIVLTAGAQAVVAYRTARDEADAIFDYHMQQMALALRSGLPVSPPPAPEVEGIDQHFDFVVQVWTADGLRVFESASRAALPQRAVLGFTNVRANGSLYRVFSMQTRSQVIQVAQDMAARQSMAGALALRSVAPVAVVAPLLMLAVWWVVSGSLAPVWRVRRQLASRQADDLSEVSENGLPAEIQPLVHELNLLLGRVRHAFEAQTNFVADAAHELRSPLAALKLQAQTLQRADDPQTRATAVGRLTAGIDRATRLVEQLLVLARQQASATAGVPPRRVALADVARQGVADAASAAREQGIDIGLQRADAGAIDGHPEALMILLRNLLDNAIRHTPDGGRIDVEVARHDAGMTLAVHDSGPGIAEAERARVLDRFYRVVDAEGEAAGVPRRSTGSGLGLAIVKSIAELHGATLALDRSPSLRGLRVTVAFPPAGAEAGPAAAPRRPPGEQA